MFVGTWVENKHVWEETLNLFFSTANSMTRFHFF